VRPVRALVCTGSSAIATPSSRGRRFTQTEQGCGASTSASATARSSTSADAPCIAATTRTAPATSFLGSIGWYDTLYLPLAAGGNELVVAVAEDFGGWGVQARLSDGR
jgi:hypothetical protein